MTKQFYAYVHARPDGTPFYVGKGSGPRHHRFEARSDWHKRIVAKCGGQEGILVGVYPVSSEEFAFELEKGLIKTLRRMGHVLCNLTSGGEGAAGVVVSQATRDRISVLHKGRVQSPEWVSRRAAAKRGVPFPEEARTRVSTSLKIHYSNPDNVLRLSRQALGKHLSDEAKAKVSAANKGKVVSVATRQKAAASLTEWWRVKKEAQQVALPEGTDRWCVTCKQPKTAGEFGKDASRKDGVNCRCRACVAEFTRKYRGAA